VIVCVAVGVSGPPRSAARAQEGGEPATDIFAEVVSLRSHGEYDRAIETIRRIIRANPNNHDVLRRAYNELVFTYLVKGDIELAEESARQALGWYPDITSDQEHVPPKVGELFDTLREQLFGTLEISTDPDACTIVLNGRNIGKSPMDVTYLRPGEHELRLSKRGYVTVSRTVTIDAGEIKNVDYSLERYGKSPRTGFGVGAGLAIPVGSMRQYGDLGMSFQGFGGVGLPYVPLAMIRVNIHGLFFGREIAAAPSDGEIVSRESSVNILKLCIGAEVFKKIDYFEPFVGGGVSLQYVWNNNTYLSGTGDVLGSEMVTTDFFRGGDEFFLGVNANAGVRLYFAWAVAFDFVVHFDWIPNVQLVNEALEHSKTDLTALSVLVDIYFGQTYGGDQ
jgi:hypothetical protein